MAQTGGVNERPLELRPGEAKRAQSKVMPSRVWNRKGPQGAWAKRIDDMFLVLPTIWWSSAQLLS